MPIGAVCAFLSSFRLVRYFALFLGHANKTGAFELKNSKTPVFTSKKLSASFLACKDVFRRQKRCNSQELLSFPKRRGSVSLAFQRKEKLRVLKNSEPFQGSGKGLVMKNGAKLWKRLERRS